jgi:hypothetical protein
LTDHFPATWCEDWRGDDPGMRYVTDNLAAANTLEWKHVGHFPLPAEAWTINQSLEK